MSAKFVSNKDETVRLFKNPILEALSHVHPMMPFVVYIPIVSLLIAMSSELTFISMIALILIGMIVWTLFEYILHRFVFHYEPKSGWGKRFHYLSHGIHHDYPKDSTRLVMPLGISLPLASLLYLPFYLFADAWGNMFFAGFLLGYMIYDGMHYAVHHVQFTGRIGRYMQTYHLKHHFQDDHKSFGVSSPLWDKVFATMPEETHQQ